MGSRRVGNVVWLGRRVGVGVRFGRMKVVVERGEQCWSILKSDFGAKD